MSRVPATHLSLRAPEGMWGDGDPAVIVDGVDRRRRRHSRFYATLEEQADDVTVAARHLLADDHMKIRSTGSIRCGTQRAFDGVVVSDRHHVESGTQRRVLDQLRGRRPPVAGVGVRVEGSATPESHMYACYPAG